MLHSGCVKRHQKFRDFVGLPMGLLREESPKTRMNTGLFGSWSGEAGRKILCKRFSTKSRMALESRADPGLNPLITESHAGLAAVAY